MSETARLPVEEVLEGLKTALADTGSAVLVAPPGAGKTTRVPLALLDAPWLAGRRILLLEPRRLAARAAAERMAALSGERVGETVGIRARLDTRVGPSTRIEVVTEGVFTRLILDDPALTDTGLVIFDEFHERSLDADLGLALTLDARAGLREDLRVLVMSATLDAARVATLLGAAPVLQSEGRTFPVETRYTGRISDKRIEEQMADAIARAVAADRGSLLAFLPGQAEIRRTAERLAPRLTQPDIDIVELHGGLDPAAQARAIRPAQSGRRKIVLATGIAQTSITIEDVRIVVDSGLERVPRYEPDVGVTSLATVRVSRATADQRRGRAGRRAPGVAYRLWDQPQTAGLAPFTTPEMLAADLAPLILDCAAWGVTDPTALAWLDPPPAGALAAARGELAALGALDASGALTPSGRALRSLPLPPRLARMVIDAAASGNAETAAEIAALLVERGLGGTSPDLDDRLTAFRRDRSDRARALRRLAGDWARTAVQHGRRPSQSRAGATQVSTAALLALAYPDRIARGRGSSGEFLLANGRAGRVDPAHPLAGEAFLVVAELSGVARASRIGLAARLGTSELADIAGSRIVERLETYFDAAAMAVRARHVRRLDAIVLENEPRALDDSLEVAITLARGIATAGIDTLPWTATQQQLRDRVAFARAAGGTGPEPWPDLSDAALATHAEAWLPPFIHGARRLAAITPEMLENALGGLVPHQMRRRLDEAVPTHYEAPTGNRHRIDYEGEGAPILAIRVQELFGLKLHPALVGGKLPLTLHLLSPAGRPIQITRDLPRFWAGSWRDVQAEMRGRYPKHPWPDDPANAHPTSRAKPRK